MMPFCKAVLESYKQFCWHLRHVHNKLALSRSLSRLKCGKCSQQFILLWDKKDCPAKTTMISTHTQYQSNCGSRHYVSRRRVWRCHGCRGSFWQKHINIHDRREKYAKDSRVNWCNRAIWGWTERKGVKDGGRNRKRRKCVLERTSPPASQTVVFSK